MAKKKTEKKPADESARVSDAQWELLGHCFRILDSCNGERLPNDCLVALTAKTMEALTAQVAAPHKRMVSIEHKVAELQRGVAGLLGNQQLEGAMHRKRMPGMGR